MIPPSFDYVAPGSLQEAVQILNQSPEAKLLAGGQSLIPLMRFRLSSPPLVIDRNHVAGMAYVRESDGWLSIGAMTREVDIEESDVVQSRYPLLADTARVIADPLVRNMATVGGNLAHADPANDHPATMLAYRAEVLATGSAGSRIIPIEDFFVGPFETALAQDEILAEIRIPVPRASSGGAYMKLERKVGDYATAAVAVQVTLDQQGRCTSAGIGLTNVGLTPIRAKAAEESLIGNRLDNGAIGAAARLAADAADPASDMRGSEAYRRSLIRTLTGRALRQAAARAQGG